MKGPVAETRDIVFVSAEVLIFGRFQLERTKLLVNYLPYNLI